MKRSIMVFTLAAATLAVPAWAASESREKQMVRRIQQQAQQQMQQSEQARAQAEQDLAAALADKEAAEREIEKLGAARRQLEAERAARRRIEAELKAAQTDKDALKARLVTTEKQLADSVAQQLATAQKLAQIESTSKQTEGELSGTVRDLKSCQAHNASLYTLGSEMMQKYHDKSCRDALAQAEPFTGLRKVEVENLLQTWRDRLDREKLGASVKP